MVAPEAAPVRQPGPRGGMDPRPRRRRRSCCPLVSVFLRDPSSGRVYRRGKLIGKVGTPALQVRGKGDGRSGGPSPAERKRNPDPQMSQCAHWLLSLRVSVSAGVWRLARGWRGWTPGSAMNSLCGACCVAGTGVGRAVLWRGLCVQGMGVWCVLEPWCGLPERVCLRVSGLCFLCAGVVACVWVLCWGSVASACPGKEVSVMYLCAFAFICVVLLWDSR